MKNMKTLQATLAAVLLGTTAVRAAETVNVDDRLKKLEKTVDTLQQENKDLKVQLGWDAKNPVAFVKAGGKESKISLGGFVHGQGEFGGVPDARFAGIKDRFFLRRARIAVAGSFKEHFDFKFETDLGANSLSERTGYAGQLTDAFVNWNRYEAANVKFGQFKAPFGYEQLVSDTKLLTIERSLSNDRLTDGRQIGLGVAGNFYNKRLGYSVGMFNGTSVNNSFNDNDNFMYVGRLTAVPLVKKVGKEELRWSIGLDGLYDENAALSRGGGFGFDSNLTTAGTDNLFTGHRTAFGVDSQLSWGRFGLEGEFLRAQFEPANGVPSASLDAQGWYAMGTFYVLPKKLQALLKYESFDPNLDKAGNKSETWTLGLTYYLKGDDIKFAVNYLLGDQGNGLADNQGRLLTRLQFVF